MKLKSSLLILFILLIPFMVMAQVAGGAIKRPVKSQNTNKVTSTSQIKSSTNKKGPTSHQNKSKALTGYTNGHAWVDLGLPSGTLWATMNVGASKPEEYGDYFAWGETKGYNSGKTNFEWSTYKWCNGLADKMTKYCTNSSYGYNGFMDNKTELDLEDDAAYVLWGSVWRMPSGAQCRELIDSSYTTTEWTTVNGVNGRKITSKTNGNSIFLSAAGARYGMSLFDAGSCGDYWSRTLGSGYLTEASGLEFYSRIMYNNGCGRYSGRSVRPVTKKNMINSQQKRIYSQESNL